MKNNKEAQKLDQQILDLDIKLTLLQTQFTGKSYPLFDPIRYEIRQMKDRLNELILRRKMLEVPLSLGELIFLETFNQDLS